MTPPPSHAAGLAARGRSNQTAAWQPSAAPRGTFWRALLMVAGTNTNGIYKSDLALKRGAALFVAAPVRVARSLSLPHGRVLPAAGQIATSRDLAAYFGGLATATANAIAQRDAALSELAQSDPDLLEPAVVGSVIASTYEPDEGVVGVIRFDGAVPDGPLAWTRLLRPGERIGPALARLWRDGARHLLGLSAVFSDDGCGAPSYAVPTDARASVGSLTGIVAIDLVPFPSSEARLLEPTERT